jgi:hypothetical protein
MILIPSKMGRLLFLGSSFSATSVRAVGFSSLRPPASISRRRDSLANPSQPSIFA